MNSWILILGDLVFLGLMFLSRKAAAQEIQDLKKQIAEAKLLLITEIRYAKSTVLEQLPKKRAKKEKNV